MIFINFHLVMTVMEVNIAARKFGFEKSID